VAIAALIWRSKAPGMAAEGTDANSDRMAPS
jgi:hypothetical protein